jgi:hypothetical protein
MKSCQKYTKFFTIILIGMFFIGSAGLVLKSFTTDISYSDVIVTSTVESYPVYRHDSTPRIFQTETSADPLALFFQIAFILFLISPPLIVIYLCLIWKELKKRNEMK